MKNFMIRKERSAAVALSLVHQPWWRDDSDLARKFLELSFSEYDMRMETPVNADSCVDLSGKNKAKQLFRARELFSPKL